MADKDGPKEGDAPKLTRMGSTMGRRNAALKVTEMLQGGVGKPIKDIRRVEQTNIMWKMRMAGSKEARVQEAGTACMTKRT